MSGSTAMRRIARRLYLRFLSVEGALYYAKIPTILRTPPSSRRTSPRLGAAASRSRSRFTDGVVYDGSSGRGPRSFRLPRYRASRVATVVALLLILVTLWHLQSRAARSTLGPPTARHRDEDLPRPAKSAGNKLPLPLQQKQTEEAARKIDHQQRQQRRRTLESVHLASVLPDPSWPGEWAQQGIPLSEHPIPKLVREATERFHAKVSSQSRTYEDAVRVYRDRYGLEPPQGFRRWTEYALDHDHAMMDEYDVLMAQIKKYSGLAPEEIRRRTWQVGVIESMALVHIRHGRVSVTVARPDPTKDPSKTSLRADGLARLLQGFARHLPDMSFAVSELPDPRVFPPWEVVHGDQSEAEQDPPSFSQGVRYSGEDTFWKDYVRTCPPGSKARDQARLWKEGDGLKVHAPIDLGDSPTAFRRTLVAATGVELCSTSPDLHKLHSQFYQDYRAITTLHPVFTTAVTDGCADIPFPSRYYYDWLPARYQFRGTPKPTAERKDRIYWRGTALPAYDTPSNHQQDFPRRRFIEAASTHPQASRKILIGGADEAASKWKVEEQDTVALNQRLMDVSFSSMHKEQCGSSEACHSLHHSRLYTKKGGEDLRRVNDYTYLLDLDGLSYSARFQALLSSGGAVLKSTIYKEFYSDWIEPWLHFIPLSLAYDEVYDIVSFFTGIRDANDTPSDAPSAIQRRELLAQLGKHAAGWQGQFSKHDDLRSYTYRTALEWARLYRGPEWEALSPDPAVKLYSAGNDGSL